MTKKTFFRLLLIIIAVNFIGLFGDIFMQDSSLYAVISKSFSVSNDYINIYVNGNDWLDKPHFLFWLCAVFIELFGNTSFAYKLPSFLFFILGMIYTYKISKKLYNTEIAYISTLILGSSFHIFLSNNDVRAEAILLGLIMGASYYLYNLKLNFTVKNLFLSAVFLAASVMTKGIFILIIPFSALFFDMLLKKGLKDNFNVKWLLVFILTFIFIIPEIYAVYNQFDLHPEKVVFGKKNVSGMKFLFWDSQFGRFFNNGPIKGKGDITFFIHTMIWSFAPWTIIGFSSLVIRCKNLLTRKGRGGINESFTFFGFLILFIVFSLSKFQLPHYINIIYPFIAITTAALIYNSRKKWVRKLLKLSINFYSVAFLLSIVFIEYFFRTERLVVSLSIILVLLILIIYVNIKVSKYNFLILAILSISLFFVFLNMAFYPKLLKYQSGSQVAFYINKYYPKDDIIVSFNDWLLQYYTKNDLYNVRTIGELKSKIQDKNIILVADKTFFADIKKSTLDFEVLKIFESYSITRLKSDFIYYKTREKTLSYNYLIEVKTFANNVYSK
jgi:4-amino-4-deoxy-L-arabinose transferase-like glycosyltransferase